MRKISRAASMALLLVSGAAFSQADPPLLDHLKAMNLAFETLRPKFGPQDGNVSADFDETRREWVVRIDRGERRTPRFLAVSIDETSGEVCARAPATEGCVAQAEASAQLEAERDRRAALEEAKRNPPPDLQGAMAALIRYQASAAGGYLRANRETRLYVSMHSTRDGRPIDLSAATIRSLHDLHIAIFPGSEWLPPKEAGRHVGTEMTLGIRLPTRRADGDYEVQYGFWCGTLCASSHTAVLRYGAEGWRVVSSVMDSIS